MSGLKPFSEKNKNESSDRQPTAITRDELARELGISYSTLWRRMKEKGINNPYRLLSPIEVERIKSLLGFGQKEGSDVKTPPETNGDAKP